MQVYDASGSLVTTVYQDAVWGERTFEARYTSTRSNVARVVFGRETSTTIVKEVRYTR